MGGGSVYLVSRVLVMGPLPAVRDLTRDGRWSTYDVSVLKKMGGKMRTARTTKPHQQNSPGWVIFLQLARLFIRSNNVK